MEITNELQLRDLVRDVDEIRILKEDGLRGVFTNATVNLPSTDPQTAAMYTTPFFIADRNYELIKARERHETAGSDGGAVTVTVVKAASGTAPGSGTNMLELTFNLKGTA